MVRPRASRRTYFVPTPMFKGAVKTAATCHLALADHAIEYPDDVVALPVGEVGDEHLAFSLVESVEILRELLRACEIDPVRPRPERLRPRGIINAPSHGSRIRIKARAS